MKRRGYGYLAGLLITLGTIVYNGTGKDIIMPDGSNVKTYNLKEDLKKGYRTRDVDKPLYITFHHTAGSEDQSLLSVSEYHVEQRGYPAIAYHIAINKDGDVYFLNDLSEITWHDRGHNTVSIGIVFVGNYEEIEPDKDMIESAKVVADWLCKEYNIVGIRAHRDTEGSATLCCGINAYNEISPIFF